MKEAKRISLILSFVITSITILFLWLFELIEQRNLVYVVIINFIVLNIIIYLFLSKFIYNDLKTIEGVIDQSINYRLKQTNSYEKQYRIKLLQKFSKQIVAYLNRNQIKIDELEKLATFRKGFIADVSHELKTPIFAAQGFVHTLLDGAVEDQEVRIRFLEKAAKSLDNLDMLVHDLLTLSNIEIGETKMRFEYFALDILVNDVVGQILNRADKKNISISVINEKKSAIVFADWLRIKQVLNNLISNSINYTSNGGQVLVEIRQDEDNVFVEVKDNGIGIPTKDLSRIFKRFYRVDKSRSREMGGTGLGLAIVKHIMEGHNSTIEVASKQGEGSNFYFALPKSKKG